MQEDSVISILEITADDENFGDRRISAYQPPDCGYSQILKIEQPAKHAKYAKKEMPPQAHDGHGQNFHGLRVRARPHALIKTAIDIRTSFS